MSYDVIVVGGGPGGYVAAIRAAQNGKKTALVEADLLGGTCLNRGCIPSKTLLRHAELVEDIEKAKDWGIKAGNLTLSLGDMMKRKDQVISTLRGGIQHLLSKGKIDVFTGYGKIHADHSVSIQLADGEKRIEGTKIIIATGSRPVIPPVPGVEEAGCQTTDTIFDIEEIPSSIVIVGGGVIGVEMASIFSSLGTDVTIVELGDRILSTEDEDASKLIAKSLKKKGIRILTKHQVLSLKKNGSHKAVYVKGPDEKEFTVDTDEVLFAVGRVPNVSAVEELDLKMDGKHIAVNEYLETSRAGYFAVGDVIGGLQLAHVASAEGLTAVENLDQPVQKMDYRVMPRCVYTNPQVASVGMSEVELQKKAIQYKVNTYPLGSNGMALAMGETEGFCKVMIDETYGEILGVVMTGFHVTEMIGQSSAYMYLEGTVDELAKMVQPHPAMSEVLMESANALLGKGIHS